MSPLQQSLGEYLRLRRGLGYKLEGAERLLGDYLDYLDARGERLISSQNAISWATQPAGCQVSWWARRLSHVRCFARYLHALDPAHQVPPGSLLPRHYRRATPYLYSDEQITAMLHAAGTLRYSLQRATASTLVGLLSVTGMRVGEALRLDRRDLDLGHGMLIVRDTKFGKTRQLALHPSTVQALRQYLRRRDRHPRAGMSEAVFLSVWGTRWEHSSFNRTFHTLLDRAGIAPRSATCRPRPHDLRHSFAVRTLLDWYRTGADVPARLPLLSTYLGHVKPSDTYWYLQAAPELLALAAARLERGELS